MNLTSIPPSLFLFSFTGSISLTLIAEERECKVSLRLVSHTLPCLTAAVDCLMPICFKQVLPKVTSDFVTKAVCDTLSFSKFISVTVTMIFSVPLSHNLWSIIFHFQISFVFWLLMVILSQIRVCLLFWVKHVVLFPAGIRNCYLADEFWHA